jgi:serine/threonine-protein kinase
MIGTQIQNYRIIAELGEGGMGKVYKAFDTKLERFVAIKFLSPHLIKDQLFLERFRTEGKNHAKLSHPNIVMVYGFIEYKELVGLIIEYVDGFTVERLIEKYKRLNLIYSLKVIRQILLALEYAHSKGLIHRDIKPSNIIIDNTGIAKLMDFGISKSINSKIDLTRSGRNVGTILYMSPEQINNQPSTTKTDLYSLAITLYEMIGGVPPYIYDNEFKIYEAHLKGIPNKLSARLTDIPPEVDELILSAMNKSTVVNFSTASEFRKAVEDLIFSLPVKINQITTYSNEDKKTGKRIGRGILVPLFLAVSLIAFASLSYLFVENYLPKDEVKSSERSINFNSLRPNSKSEWQKIEVSEASNLIDLTLLDDKIYLIDDNSQIFVVDGDSNVQSIDNSLLKSISKMIRYNDKLILLSREGKIYITDSSLKLLNDYVIGNDAVLSADAFQDKIIFCGANGIAGIINLNSNKVNLFNRIQNTDCLDITFLNETNYLVVGMDGTVFRTDDGGRSWKSKKLSNNYLKKIAKHPHKNLILLAGAGGIIYSSEDKGENWSAIQLNVVSPVNDFLFYDLKNYYAVNSAGDFIYTNDGGLTWNIKKTEYYLSLNRITTDGKNLFIIGNNGLFLKKSL